MITSSCHEIRTLTTHEIPREVCRAYAARVLSHLIRVGSLSWKRGRLLTSRTERTPDSRLDLLSRQQDSQLLFTPPISDSSIRDSLVALSSKLLSGLFAVSALSFGIFETRQATRENVQWLAGPSRLSVNKRAMLQSKLPPKCLHT